MKQAMLFHGLLQYAIYVEVSSLDGLIYRFFLGGDRVSGFVLFLVVIFPKVEPQQFIAIIIFLLLFFRLMLCPKLFSFHFSQSFISFKKQLFLFSCHANLSADNNPVFSLR